MMAAGARAGFSLIEVLLATSILLGSLIVLEELARFGRRQALDAEDAAAAQSLARAKLNELIVGAAPLKTTDARPIDEAPEWVCTISVEPTGSMGLSEIAVTVAKGDQSSLGRSAPQLELTRTGAHSGRDAAGSKGRSFTLVRWARSPKNSTSNGPLSFPAPGMRPRFASREGQ